MLGFCDLLGTPYALGESQKFGIESAIFFSPLTFFGLSTLEKFKITLEQIFLTVSQKWYFVIIIVLTFCEKKNF